MRDAFGYAFAAPKQETNPDNSAQDSNLKGMPVSSNGYYGFQPLPQRDEEERLEYMDIQTNDCGIQFNNFIAPADRLGAVQEVNVVRGPVNRKRRWSDDAPLLEFKKRRETDTVGYTPSERKFTQETLLKGTVDELIEELLRETHGCSVYHWMNDSL